MTFLTACVAVPAVRVLAWRMGAVDVPRDGRRLHSKRMPRCGGLAIFAALTVGALTSGVGKGSAILAGGMILLAVGLADDIYTLSPILKLTGQVIAAYIASKPIEGVSGIFAIAWIVLLSNAHNLIDGMDGLMTGTAVIECAVLGWMLLACGQRGGAELILLLGSAGVGFWLFNRHPASIFAGDCGSCTVGYLLGACSIPLIQSGEGVLESVAPLLVFAYPLTDLITAVVRRILRLKSPFDADRGHLHHRLLAAGLTQRQCAWVLHLQVILLSVVGGLMRERGAYPIASAACLATVVWMIAVRREILFISQKTEKR
jgi:UDP-GlcNAc:undecaprenyl-phosphate GlcNAc-1-phosphate transferase